MDYLSWLGLTALSILILSSSHPMSPGKRGAWVLLAATYPMFWSKLIFSLFSGYLLILDASLVSSLMGLPRQGNVITLADGVSHLWIAPACSSMANVSLVVVCWTLFCQIGQRGFHGQGIWCVVCCCSIVAINVIRISCIGWYPDHYDLIHGPIGSSIVSWLLVGVTLTIVKYGMLRAR
ncbi:hypothetical protein [Alsobacter sp. KACC 23698]|uniref:hypothetical protein n=1 Tax=Alsobacter sp. KACC 23698 TaxID=3149229 RepID=UPI0038782DBE